MQTLNDLRRKHLGSHLRKWRIKAKLTQWDVAMMLDYTTAQFISNWERGVSYPPVDALALLAELLNTRSKDLVNLIYDVKEMELALERKQALAVVRR